jgi:hypothetical protein
VSLGKTAKAGCRNCVSRHLAALTSGQEELSTGIIVSHLLFWILIFDERIVFMTANELTPRSMTFFMCHQALSHLKMPRI